MTAVATHASSTELRALDALLVRSTDELATMYARARTPRLDDVGGDLRGRMLAWPLLDGHPWAAGALRAFAGGGAFPWRGKSFRPDARRGDGINRVLSDRLRLFRFETFLAKSRAGDFDALQLDYDLPANPPIIRSIKDEIRELEPDLLRARARDWAATAVRVATSRSILHQPKRAGGEP